MLCGAAASCCCFCCCCSQEDDEEGAEDACAAGEGAEAGEEEVGEEDDCLGDDLESETEKDGTKGTFKDFRLCIQLASHSSRTAYILQP